MLTGSAQPSRDQSLVHALFAQNKFEARVDYNTVFYDAAVLATRLMNSPQGELDAEDIAAVQRERLTLASRIRYQVLDLHKSSLAETQAEKPTQYKSGTGSLILISKFLYNIALVRNRTPEDYARVQIQVATTLLHEVAHAAHNHLYGTKLEDFREADLVAEASYKIEARLFGMRPGIKTHDPSYGPWRTWQYYKIESRAAMRYLCRDIFWSGEYVRDGALALLPYATAQYCRDLQARDLKLPGDVKDNLVMPQSISDLFRSGGPSYAKVLYSQSANPGLVLRNKQPFPVAKLDVPKAGKQPPKNPKTPTKKPTKVTKQPAKKPVKRSNRLGWIYRAGRGAIASCQCITNQNHKGNVQIFSN
ncbi:hypothetical protein Q7P36_008950 [Cladosporium allicinum]